MPGRGYRRGLAAGAVTIFVFATSTVARASTNGATATRGEVIVKLRGGFTASEVAPMHADGERAAEVAPRTYVVGTGADAAAAARVIAAQPGVEYAEANQLYRASGVLPNDPCVEACAQGDQWYLDADHAAAAWAVTRGSASVVVAVLDSAVRSHPDLAGKFTAGPDFSNANDWCGTITDVDHGTHVAGVIGARTGNAAGIAGLGWNTRVLGVGVLNARGCGDTVSIVKGIRYAADHGARVLNLSLGGPPSNAVEDAVRYAQSRGALVVAAAGNSGWTFPEYPAAYSGVVSVAATTKTGRIAAFSNRGTWVDVAAPGVDILSTTVDGNIATYSGLDGTSFAAPQVSATAALLLAANPCMSSNDLSQRMFATAARIPSGGVRYGSLDTGRALTPPARGFRVAAANGGVYTRGGECYFGSAANVALRSPVVGMTSTTNDRGYWLVAADGGVFAFGNAQFHGSAATLPLVQPIVAMQATPTGRGYWLVASDGGVFAYGDAHFYGSTGGIRLHRPVLGMAVTPTGHGYWLVASDGGIFAFGDARFYGSTGGISLVSPVTGMTAAAGGNGYLLVAGDGGVFAFGGARFRGSSATGARTVPTTGIAMTNSGRGYWVVEADGTVHAFGDATPYGDVPANGAVAINAARRG